MGTGDDKKEEQIHLVEKQHIKTQKCAGVKWKRMTPHLRLEVEKQNRNSIFLECLKECFQGPLKMGSMGLKCASNIFRSTKLISLK